MKLNSKGFAHHLIFPIVAIITVATIGFLALQRSSAYTDGGASTPTSSCGSGYKLLVSRGESMKTSLYYKKSGSVAKKNYKFTFCAKYKQTVGNATHNMLYLMSSGMNASSDKAGYTSGPVKLSVAKKNQCVSTDVFTYIPKTVNGKTKPYTYKAPQINAFYVGKSKVCSF